MRKFLKFAFVVMFFVSCAEVDNPTKSEFLDVTHNNISGVWSLASYDNGTPLADGTYYYIVFNRAERTFVSYDNLGSMETYKSSGRYDIFVDNAAIIRGVYDFGRGDWEHRYYVRNLTANKMTWVAVDDENNVKEYVRAELPEWIEQEQEK